MIAFCNDSLEKLYCSLIIDHVAEGRLQMELVTISPPLSVCVKFGNNF